MAIDGSFSLESELRRFLARCPKLASIPQIDSLLKKVHETNLNFPLRNWRDEKENEFDV